MGSGELGVGSRESGVGECGIIDLDSIVPIQPETISRLKKPGFRSDMQVATCVFSGKNQVSDHFWVQKCQKNVKY